jgi:putative Holliday junction resolvase
MTSAPLLSIHKISVPASPSAKPSRILALDYGRKRIGVAISDELLLTAQPLLTLTRKNRRDDLVRLRHICRTHNIARILVGHPLHITGEAGEMADEAARFAARVRKELGIVVELADERLTSWEAAQTMSDRSTTSRRHKGGGHLDDVAAAILLREYLDRHHHHHTTGAGPKDS